MYCGMRAGLSGVGSAWTCIGEGRSSRVAGGGGGGHVAGGSGRHRSRGSGATRAAARLVTDSYV
jgi:hypothetical protein